MATEEKTTGEKNWRGLALLDIEAAIEALKSFNPEAENAPGPEQTNSGKAYQATTALLTALGWVQSIQ